MFEIIIGSIALAAFISWGAYDYSGYVKRRKNRYASLRVGQLAMVWIGGGRLEVVVVSVDRQNKTFEAFSPKDFTRKKETFTFKRLII